MVVCVKTRVLCGHDARINKVRVYMVYSDIVLCSVAVGVGGWFVDCQLVTNKYAEAYPQRPWTNPGCLSYIGAGL